MKKYRDRDFREALQHISTQDLDKILQEELKKTPVDQGSVKIILRELKEREKGNPAESGVESGKSWIRYLSCMKYDERGEKRKYGRLAKGVATALLAVVLLVWLPQEAKAKGFFERISRWTDEFLVLFSPDENIENQYEYVFTTDNPGLQKLYDAVVEMGVTGPAVPMWLPEGYKLVELKQEIYGKNEILNAAFSDGQNDFIWELIIYSSNAARKFYKDKELGAEYEFMGTCFQIVNNTGTKLVLWSKDNCEFSFWADCPEEVIYKIIYSIFTARENYHEKNLETSLYDLSCPFTCYSARICNRKREQ